MDHLTELFQEIWRQGEVPQDFNDVTIVHLYKRKGNRQVCSNHRGISWLNIAGKIFARILLNRLNNHLEQILMPESQCGFRRHRGTTDMIFSARQLQEKCQEMRTHLCSTYVDLTKAFDTVNREGLWKIMQQFGCPERFIQMMRQLNDGMMASVTDNGAVSEAFAVTNGVKQGCVLAPTLFSLMSSAMLMDAYRDGRPGLRIAYRTDGYLLNQRRMHFQSRVTCEFIARKLANQGLEHQPIPTKLVSTADAALALSRIVWVYSATCASTTTCGRQPPATPHHKTRPPRLQHLQHHHHEHHHEPHHHHTSTTTHPAAVQTAVSHITNPNTTTDTTPTSPDTTDEGLNYTCPHCDRPFTSRIGLVGHLRIHRTETGEPVPEAPTYTHRTRLHCPHCTRTFTHCMGLFGHMRIHESGIDRSLDTPTTLRPTPSSSPCAPSNLSATAVDAIDFSTPHSSPSYSSSSFTATTTAASASVAHDFTTAAPDTTTGTTPATSIIRCEGQDYICPHCDRTSTSRIGLVGHLRIHRTETGEPVPGAPTYTHRTRLHYPHCHRTFTHRMGLFGHMRIHGGGIDHNSDTPTTPVMPSTTLAPSICATTNASSVADTDTAAFTCPHCPRTFTSRIGLVGQLRIHRTETGEQVPGAPTYTHHARLNCHTVLALSGTVWRAFEIEPPFFVVSLQSHEYLLIAYPNLIPLF
nr:unnamed protein product [Spirometra erinaceieuropaei]